MRFEIEKIDGPVWVNNFSELAHRAVFGEVKPKEWDRIDFALLATTESGPIGYMTCREWSDDMIYMQFGGAFPPIKDTIYSFQVYQAFLRWHKERYKRCVTYIENNNHAMLKMAMKVGFLITGVRNYKGCVLLENLLEFENVV